MPFDATACATRRRRAVKVADLFCGAGGTSSGAKKAIEAMGRRMDLVAVNCWPTAIESHRRMLPEARHYCQNLNFSRPLQLVPEGRLDLLMASPTCTYHSSARGGRPVSDQLRMDPWHVITWISELRVTRLLIENVPEFVNWGPVDPRTMRPIRSRRGEYFRAWLAAMAALGYRFEWRMLVCADYGDATTRRRFFLQARNDGRPINWPVPTHSETGAPGTLRWRSARDIIDWSDPGVSIFTRPKPLAPRTIQRIYAGIHRNGWPQPYLVVLRRHMDARSIDLPVPTIAAKGTHIGLATPFMLSQASGGAARSVGLPVPTIPGGGAHALISPYYGAGSGLTLKSTEAPLDTLTTKARFGLVVPITHGGGETRSHSVDRPVPTITRARRGELAFISGDQPQIQGKRYDIFYRMLNRHELARAQSFDDEGTVYDFAGNNTEIIEQLGNAVPQRTARALVDSSLYDLA
jgi:DNA (cytosine-5)-methyltransferase 1